MLRLCWLSLLLAFGHPATLWVQGPLSSTLDYRAILKAHPNAVSPTQDYLNHHPLIENREKLLTLLTWAQHDFLAKSNAEAVQKFKDVLQMLWEDDWAQADREIFLQAYLRIAQLSLTNTERDLWLIQSVALK